MSPSDITTIKKTVGIQNQKKSTNAKQTKKKIFTQKSVGKGGVSWWATKICWWRVQNTKSHPIAQKPIVWGKFNRPSCAHNCHNHSRTLFPHEKVGTVSGFWNLVGTLAKWVMTKTEQSVLAQTQFHNLRINIWSGVPVF